MPTDERLKLKIRPETVRLLKKLAEQGLFGETKEEVAARLLDEKLREVILQGWMGVPGMPGETQPLIR